MATAAATTLPAPDELAQGDFEMVVRRLADDLAFGVDHSRFVGSGIEYAQSRAYAPGDSIKMMDWRITARLGRPFVKEYDSPKRTSVYIVLDTSRSMSVASTALSKHALAVWIASALGLIAQRRMSPVAIIGAGERTTPFHPSLNRADLWRALDPLRTAAPRGERTSLGTRLDELSTRARRASVIIALSDLHDPGALAALRHSAQRHDCIAIHFSDPAEGGRLKAGFFRGEEAETGRAFVSHSRASWEHEGTMRTDLARAGVSYLRLSTHDPFIAPLRHFLSFRPMLGGGRA